jgi:predicted MPP superfamily phosphohydrolase
VGAPRARAARERAAQPHRDRTQHLTLRFGRTRIALLLIVAVFLAGVAKAWHDTMADPVVRRATVVLPAYPADAPPTTIALISDLHVAGPDMPPSRLAEIISKLNILCPDLVLVAGDIVSDKRPATRHYTTAEAVAPLAALTPGLATVVVPGNHDHWRGVDEIRHELAAVGAVVLTNDAHRFGPLVIGGLDDDYTGHADVPATLAAMDRLGGAQVMLSHSPDPFPDVPRPLAMLAGHTHCGQLAWPWGGSPATMSRYGQRYACGLVRENGKVLVTTAGLGTSVLPFRLFTRPEIWLIEVRPPS